MSAKSASTRQRRKLPKQLVKPATFVPKVHLPDDEEERGRGRPSTYDPETHPQIAQTMAAAGAPEYAIAAHLGISPVTMWSWKAAHPEFLKALTLGKDVINQALRATMIQRALGFSYVTQKAFQTGVVVTVTETLPPSEKMLQFLAKNRMPEEFNERQDVSVHHGMSDMIKSMNDRVAIRRAEIEKEVLQLRLQEKKLLSSVTIIEPEVTASLSRNVATSFCASDTQS